MEKTLRGLGFSEREVRVYLALLELGEVTVGPLAAKTRIQHSKVYQTIEKLIDRGLVSFVIKSKTRYFQAQDPRNILHSLKEKEREFLDILPNLVQLKKKAREPQIARVYEGYKAIRAMFDGLFSALNDASIYYVFAFKEEYLQNNVAKDFLRNIHLKLAEKRVDDRLIAHVSIKKAFLSNYNNIGNLKMRFTHMNLPLGLMIIDNKVINWVWGERPTAIEITSTQIAGQYKKFFLETWKLAK